MNATGCAQTTPHRTHARAPVLVVHFTRDHTCGSRDILRVSFKSHFIFDYVSLECSSHSVSVCCHSIYHDPTPLTGIRLNPWATSLWSGLAGHIPSRHGWWSVERTFCRSTKWATMARLCTNAGKGILSMERRGDRIRREAPLPREH